MQKTNIKDKTQDGYGKLYKKKEEKKLSHVDKLAKIKLIIRVLS